MKQYGLCYQGSKNRIAEWVVSNIPHATDFYDFVAVAAIKISVQMQGGSGKQATEKLFVPRHQYDEYKKRIGWLF